jgi:hypothetical protein
LLLIAFVLIGAVSLVAAQPVDFTEFEDTMSTFATGVAGTLASTATAAGLGWSPAYIGQFPHLGVGVSLGASLLPYATVQPILDLVGVSLPAELASLQEYGLPIPAASIDARIGGFFLPFDIGVKVGYLPTSAQDLLGAVQMDYLLVGGDVRFALLQDRGFVPALSVGVGYTYFKGRVGLPGVIPGTTDLDVTEFMNLLGYTGTHSISLSEPDFAFEWQSNVIEAKAQLSKRLLLFIPHVGISAAYGISTAGGGLASTLTYTSSDGYTDTDLQDAFEEAGYPAPSAEGFVVTAAANGWSFRVFGGLDIALLFLHLDVAGSYNLLTGSLGGSANVRIQF